MNTVAESWLEMMTQAIVMSLAVVAITCVVASLWRTRPHVLFYLWMAACTKLLILLVSTWSVPVTLGPVAPLLPAQDSCEDSVVRFDQTAAGADTVSEAGTTSPTILPTWKTVTMLAWAGVVAFLLWALVQRWIEHRGMLADATTGTPDELTAVDALRQSMGIKSRVLVFHADIPVPLITGWRRPTIVLPHHLRLSDSRKSFQHAVAHELAHVQRHDLAWVWIPTAACLLFFFHPLVYYIRRQIEFARETACDQVVARQSGIAEGYAKTLLSFATRDASKI